MGNFEVLYKECELWILNFGDLWRNICFGMKIDENTKYRKNERICVERKAQLPRTWVERLLKTVQQRGCRSKTDAWLLGVSCSALFAATYIWNLVCIENKDFSALACHSRSRSLSESGIGRNGYHASQEIHLLVQCLRPQLTLSKITNYYEKEYIL